MAEWLPTVSHASTAAQSTLNARPTFLTPFVLPYHLSLLPSTFRLLAVMFFLPVLFLAFADLVGYVVFRLFLRPLGYASTVRFKDPEPTTLLNQSQVKRRSRSTSRPDPNTRRTAVQLGAGINLSRTSSLPASFRSRHAVTTDALRAAATAQHAGSPLVGELSAPSSNGSSPVMTYSDSIASSPSSSRAPSIASSPSNSPRNPLVPLPHPSSSSGNTSTLAGAGDGSTTAVGGAKSSGKKARRRSHSASSDSFSALRRFRAPSVGFDGPLLFASGSGADSEDGLMSPLRSDDDVEQSMSSMMSRGGSATSGEDSEGSADDSAPGAEGIRRRRKEGGGMRRGPGFGFTQMPAGVADGAES